MEGSCSTGQSPQWAVVPVEEEEEEDDDDDDDDDNVLLFRPVGCRALSHETFFNMCYECISVYTNVH
jgi:hypothetical protein